MLAVIAAIFVIGAVISFIGTTLIERAHPPRGRFVEIAGLRQHFIETGESAQAAHQDIPIVLIHGAGCNLEDMRLALGDRLAGRRVISIDRPGHGWSERGWSDRRGRQGSSPEYQAAVVRQVLDRIGVDRAILVGHSWGGALALRLALDHPQRVSGLVLLAPPLYPLFHGVTWFYELMATPFLGGLIAHTMLMPVGLLFIGVGFWGAFLPQMPPRRYLKCAGTLLSLRPKTFLANSRDIADLKINIPPQAARYATLAVPTTIVTGDRDLIVAPRQHAMAFAAAVPAAKLVVLPGVGHMLHHAAPERVAAEIERMMDGK
ncbi:MAG TPA: alpha/beta hydrolase [Xanthobacteraceae bacterium]|nr:alpha/beta hydrolase [Xanthobacteraceae bacterium]